MALFIFAPFRCNPLPQRNCSFSVISIALNPSAFVYSPVSYDENDFIFLIALLYYIYRASFSATHVLFSLFPSTRKHKSYEFAFRYVWRVEF